ncbi:hypothetical protein H7142_00420 [Candidatus Saccharibacteria bacterium]|nr:hypothetical protein [Candidatus Saccharibacteria bacterium]
MTYNRDRLATSTGDWNKIPISRGETLVDKESIYDDSLELWQLETGDVIHVVASTARETYEYDFFIRSANVEPTVVLMQTGPDGSVVFSEDYEFTLRGSGRWVGREWPLWKHNNERSDGKQMMIDIGTLRVGDEIVLFDGSLPYEHRMATLMPPITTIDVIKYEDSSENEDLIPDTTSVIITE